MTSKKQHMHWISAIETLNTLENDDDPYHGIRLTVHHSKSEMEADLKAWVEEELDQVFDRVEDAIKAYQDGTGKRIRVETQHA